MVLCKKGRSKHIEGENLNRSRKVSGFLLHIKIVDAYYY